MLKKMMLLAIAAFALVAFAAPALAQAQQLYTLNEEEEHVPLAENAAVWATSTGFNVLLTSPEGYWAELTCEEIIMKEKGEFSQEGLENNASESRIKFLGGFWEFVGGCNYEVSNQQEVDIVLQGEEAGVMEGLEFTVDGRCLLSGDPPLTYEHDANTVTIPETELEVHNGYNGVCGNSSFYFDQATMSASYTLTTPTGTPVYIE